MRHRRTIALAAVLAAGASVFALGGTSASTAATNHRHPHHRHHHHHHVLLVCNHKHKCPRAKHAHYFKSLQLAVDNATNGDYILIWPGRYNQSTTVQRGHGLTSGLHIRGMNRNGVVFDGKKTGGSAVHVLGVNKVWVENMTGQDYAKGSANAFYYDSTSSGKTPAAFAFDYGSWNADSGIYIGGCRDCNAVITNSRAAHNPIGYSGTNAGGELFILNSEWDHNASGIVPNTLTSEPDPPQSGGYIVGNFVHDNNAHNTPGSGITAIAPVGNGIEIAGGSDDVIRANRIINEKHTGVLLHWLYTPPTGNQVVYNYFRNVGWAHKPGDADFSNDGTGVNNCGDHNVDWTGGHRKAATTDPADVGNTQRCDDQNPGRGQGKGIYEFGDPIVSAMTALNAVGVTEPKDYKGPGKHPEAKKTMPNPCKGVPNNPWCKAGKPKFKIPHPAAHTHKHHHRKHHHGHPYVDQRRS
jgi:hypothetical protein